MSLFQGILLFSFLIIFVAYFTFFKQRALARLFFALVFALGILFILVPALTSYLATFFNIGRGADLVFYTSIITFYLAFIVLYSKQSKNEEMISDLTRQIAIRNGKKLN